jgi:MinD-like ATPase involved in chromosome partitioning or flagellar assembly
MGARGATTLERRDLHRGPLVDGREAPDRALGRLKRRMASLVLSRAEREEVDLERRLRALPGPTRPNVIALISPRGGVGKTTGTFLAGNLLASHLKLRAIAVDANPDFGTLGRLLGQHARAERSLADLLDDADRLATAAELRRYVSRLPSGLHLLAAPKDATLTASLGPDRYGELIALLSCFYDTVLLDLGTGVTGPLARLAIDRADQLVLVTTPDRLTATVVLDALDHLPSEQVTVVVNKAHPHPADELRAVEACFGARRPHGAVTIPFDRRLTTMLDTGTYSLEALDPPTRLSVKRLGISVAEQLV